MYNKPPQLRYDYNDSGKIFKHKSNLKIHQITHTKSALECHYCHKKFARKLKVIDTKKKQYECNDTDDNEPIIHSIVALTLCFLCISKYW